MTDSRNSLILGVGLLALAVAIAFHAWWPSYKTEQYVADCIAPAIAKVNKATAAEDKAEDEPGLIPSHIIRATEQAESELFEARHRCIREASLLFR